MKQNSTNHSIIEQQNIWTNKSTDVRTNEVVKFYFNIPMLTTIYFLKKYNHLQLHHEYRVHLHILHVIEVPKVKNSNLHKTTLPHDKSSTSTALYDLYMQFFQAMLKESIPQSSTGE